MGEIKSRAGGDFPVTFSISGYERSPGGRAIDDTQRIARDLVAAGVDAFRVSGGISDSLVTMMVGRSEYGQAHNLAQAEALKNVVDAPVMLVGRIHDPELAETILAKGQADLIAMARPLLADPYLPSKVIAGKPERIRRCISCENCIDSMQMSDNLGCAVNPFSGREDDLVIPRGNRKVVVVGGGAAGMSAARESAEAGHRVVLYESQNRLGGSLVLASTVHSDNERFLQWLLAEVKRLPIEINLGHKACVATIKAQRPDSVIIATGAVVATPAIPGIEQAHVLTGSLMPQMMAGKLAPADAHRLRPWVHGAIKHGMPLAQKIITPKLLRDISRVWMPIGHEVVIIGADLAAIELAEFLSARKRRVHVLDNGKKIIPEVGKKRRNEHMDRLDRLQVTVNTSVDIVEITKGGVVIKASGIQRTIKANTIIVAGHPEGDTTLANVLEGEGIKVQSIGDCTGLGLIVKATRSAAEAVAKIG